jgi:hypothetical protein
VLRTDATPSSPPAPSTSMSMMSRTSTPVVAVGWTTRSHRPARSSRQTSRAVRVLCVQRHGGDRNHTTIKQQRHNTPFSSSLGASSSMDASMNVNARRVSVVIGVASRDASRIGPKANCRDDVDQLRGRHTQHDNPHSDASLARHVCARHRAAPARRASARRRAATLRAVAARLA